MHPAGEEAASLARNPDVGGARVEDHLELLTPNFDGSKELSVLIIVDDDGVS